MLVLPGPTSLLCEILERPEEGRQLRLLSLDDTLLHSEVKMALLSVLHEAVLYISINSLS